MSTTIRQLLLWHRPVVLAAVFVALTGAYLCLRFGVGQERLLLLVVALLLLPFGAVPSLVQLNREAVMMTGSTKDLSFTESMRVKHTISRKRQIYRMVGAMNLAFGTITVIFVALQIDKQLQTFFLFSGAIFAVLTYLISWFESMYYAEIRQQFEEREARRSKRDALLKAIGSGGEKHAA